MLKEKAGRGLLLVGGLIAVLVAVFVFGAPKTAMAENAGERLISVNGEASLDVQPDMVHISFGVEITADNAQDAQRENALKMNAVIDALKAVGIPKESIQTSDFSLYPVYEWRTDGVNKAYEQQVLVGYRCSNRVSAKLKDLGQVGTVIDNAVTAGATNVGGLSFGLQNPSAHRATVLTAAVKDAENKAQIMAKAAGVTISGVHMISDGYTSVESVRGVAAFDAMKSAVAPSIEPGSVTIRATVRVDYSF